MLVSVAYAQEQPIPPVAEPSMLSGILPPLLMIALFYFILIRPQKKKIDAHKKMVSALRRGDKVVTIGGIYGTVSKVEDDALQIEIAPDVKVKIDRNSVGSVVTRTEPADTAKS